MSIYSSAFWCSLPIKAALPSLPSVNSSMNHKLKPLTLPSHSINFVPTTRNSPASCKMLNFSSWTSVTGLSIFWVSFRLMMHVYFLMIGLLHLSWFLIESTNPLPLLLPRRVRTVLKNQERERLRRWKLKFNVGARWQKKTMGMELKECLFCRLRGRSESVRSPLTTICAAWEWAKNWISTLRPSSVRKWASCVPSWSQNCGSRSSRPNFWTRSTVTGTLLTWAWARSTTDGKPIFGYYWC